MSVAEILADLDAVRAKLAKLQAADSEQKSAASSLSSVNPSQRFLPRRDVSSAPLSVKELASRQTLDNVADSAIEGKKVLVRVGSCAVSVYVVSALYSHVLLFSETQITMFRSRTELLRMLVE